VARLLVLLVVSMLALSACGDDDETTPTETSQARVYFQLDEKVWPVARDLPDGDDPASDVVAELAAGPNDGEQEIGLAGAFPEDVDVDVADGVATVTFEGELTREQLAQLVYSLTALSEPVVRSVVVDGKSYARGDFEAQTPSVLVESPLPYAQVTTPLDVSGTANTFEANFQYELLDAEGNVVDENFVTATSGTGTRGTFEFTTAEVDEVSTLVVFETSAEDGSRMREVEIPLVDAS
jgi:germination protein M